MVAQRELVLLSYPFSDMSASKVRPAIIISNDKYNSEFSDAIVVPVTSNVQSRKHAISLSNADLETGHLVTESVIKVDRILSVKQSLVRKSIGKVKTGVLSSIRKVLLGLIDGQQ